VFDSMLKQSGCIRVETLNQMLDVAQFVLSQPLPAGPRVGIVGNSDALGTLIADACVSWGLAVVHGPVALHPQADPGQFRTALTAAFGQAGVDAVVAAFIPPIATDADELAGVLSGVAAGHPAIPVVACFLGMSGMTAALSSPRLIPSYPTPEEAVRALATAERYAAWRRRDPGRRYEPADLDPAAARAIVAEALVAIDDGGAAELDQDTTARLLAAFGITLVTDPVTATAGTAEPGVACMIHTVEDPLFGPVVSFGLSGDASELLGDVAHRIPPLTDVDIADLVRSVRAAPKLFGRHGAPAVDVPALENLIGRVACLADELPEVADLELNPVLVRGQGLAVLAAYLRLARPVERSDTARRELPGG
jgi:acyl-CoA synthetase (NDP forming)